MDLDDRSLLARSQKFRHAATLGDRAARHRAHDHEAEVRRRFTDFAPLASQSQNGNRPRKSLLTRLVVWFRHH
ncbi:MAG: hypothetical protein EOP77_01620 [Variovorax sp.]|nr:MAG: hypothetical protein EOP77_01620 [Variovorax sp.]